MQTYTGPQIWAGIECTINRVGDNYHQQLDRNGHIDRLSDLDKFAALGIKTMRYPILWEQIAPGKLEDADWSWADERLERLRALGICPIVGFVHHGSGPLHTSLVDPGFPEKLAAYAAAFAERYPWIEYFTPVNEPLTTARFSGLYGLWYPHGRDNATFATTLINQCKAVVLSMQVIRKKIPGAKLVQTEDLCKIQSTPLLAYQAEFENERRWLSLDLLCGRVKPGHRMWDVLLSYHISPETLTWFIDNACPPSIMGINHYVTSNRFLDENLHLYPEHCHGGNARHRYADLEAVRVPYAEPFSLNALLKEVWNRYKLPVAVTEVHLGGHREEQLRWLKECWETAVQLHKEHVDIKAITVWSLLGAFDWNSLVTRNDHCYESGVFDIRANTVRPTALSTMISQLIANKSFDHPVLTMPGFWKRNDRFVVQHHHAHELVLSDNDTEMPERDDLFDFNTAPVMILGTEDTFSECFSLHCKSRAIHYVTLSREEVNLEDAVATQCMIEQFNPWAVILTTDYYKNDSINLANVCKLNDTQLLILSSAPGVEKKVLEIMPGALIIRNSDLCAPDLVNVSIDLLIDREQGVRHLTNDGALCVSDFRSGV